MRNKPLLTVAFCLSAAVFTACGNPTDTGVKSADTAASRPPVTPYVAAPFKEQQIGSSDYYISVPGDYAISVTNGPDFSVYYMAPADTAIHNAWTCGMYLGNHPNAFGPSGDHCTTDTLQGELLGQHPAWTVFHCQEKYSLQCIVDNKPATSGREQVHAFGHAADEASLKQILQAFASLRKKP